MEKQQRPTIHQSYHLYRIYLLISLGIHARNDPVSHIHNTCLETYNEIDYSMARTYHSHMLATQAVPNQGPIPLALALISAPTNPKEVINNP